MTNEFPKSRLSVAGLGISEDARKTMNAAIDAFSDWREEIAENTEKNSKAVFDQMAAAAKAFGWPSEFVEMTRQQMQNATSMQLQLMDQIMSVWEQQLQNPGASLKAPHASSGPGNNHLGSGGGTGFPGMPMMPGAMFPGMFGSMFPGGTAPGAMFPGMPMMPGMGSMPINPFQFWMQAAEMWQKSWQQAAQSFAETQSNAKGKGR